MQRSASIVPIMPTHIDTMLKLPKSERMEVTEASWLSVAHEETLRDFAGRKRIVGERLERWRCGKSELVFRAEIIKRLRRKYASFMHGTI